jgi:hypothetical protein
MRYAVMITNQNWDQANAGPLSRLQINRLQLADEAISIIPEERSNHTENRIAEAADVQHVLRTGSRSHDAFSEPRTK